MIRPRRLRQSAFIRGLARETRLSPDSLIYPIFIKSGLNSKEEINSMKGQYHVSPDRAEEIITEALEKNVNKFLLFGLPESKDECGSEAYSEDGVINKSLRILREKFKDEIFLITDVCMCEYTSHGHCGILDGQNVDNDKTVSCLSEIALSNVLSGADMVAPSDMMDMRVKAIRDILDKNGRQSAGIMSYAVKYSSGFYGPFREAADSAPQFGDRKSYQMDYHNKKEALKEANLDTEEGADILIVKPALSYLDIIQSVSDKSLLPTAAYSVSGEYSMIKAAAQAGYVDEYNLMCETAVSIYRAGADILISYYAKELAEAIRKGDIG